MNGKAVVRYNHYKRAYDVVDGRLNWEHVDDQYAISFVFKGDWTCHLSCEATGERVLPDGGALTKEMRKDPDGFDPGAEEEKWCGFFSGLTVVDAHGKPKEYRLEVQEDTVWEAAQGPKKTYKGASASSSGMPGASRGSALITAELKKMSTEELREGGERYKELLAARDLEDVMGEGLGL